MKLKNIINTLSIAAVALIVTACQDTDAQIEITDVDAPQLVSTSLTEEKPIFFGETTIKVAFDKNIGFATKNANQITINGGNNAIANNNSSATVVSGSKKVKVKTTNVSNTAEDERESKAKKLIKAILTNLASNLIWYILSALFGAAISYFVLKLGG